jgi:type I restriction enzyme S subunit
MSELPNGWAEARFPELVFFQEGPGLRKFQYRDSGVPFLNIRTFKDGRIDKGLCRFLDPDEVQAKYQHFLVNENDILVAISGSIGKWAIAHSGDLPIVLNTSIMRFRPLDEEALERRFLFWFLLSNGFTGQAWGSSTGSAQSNVGPSHVKEFILPVPPISEQRRIVAKLDSLRARSSRARQELDHIPKLIERYKQAILAKAFSGELTADWRTDHDLESGETVTLSSVADDFSYGSSAKSSPTGRVPVLRMGNIQHGKLDWADLVYTSDESEVEKYRLRSGDVLFNRTNSPELVGKTALFTGDREAIYAGYLIRVRCGEHLLPSYLTYCLNSPLGRDYCWQVKTDGVSQSNVNATKLAAFEFLLPSVEEQTEIVRLIDHAFAWLDKIATEHARADHLLPKLDQAILAKAFRGELVPQDPSDEPASVLLERIREERNGSEQPRRRRARS